MANADKGAYEYLSIYKGNKFISYYGNDNNDGDSWKYPYATHEKSLNNIDNNSVVLVSGSFNEEQIMISELNLDINLINIIYKIRPLSHLFTVKVNKIYGNNRSQIFDGYNFIQGSAPDTVIFYGLTFKNCSFTGFTSQLANNCNFINCIINLPNGDLSDLVYIKNSDFYNCTINSDTNPNFRYFIYNDTYGVMYNCTDNYLSAGDDFLTKYHNVYAKYNTGTVNNPLAPVNAGNNIYAELNDYNGNPRISESTVDSSAVESNKGEPTLVRFDPSTSGDNFNSNDTFTPNNGVVSPWAIYYYSNSNFDELPIPYAGNSYIFINWCLDAIRKQQIYYPGNLDGNNNPTTVGNTSKLYAKYIASSEVKNCRLVIEGSDILYLDKSETYEVYLDGTYNDNTPFKFKLDLELNDLNVSTNQDGSFIYKGNLSVIEGYDVNNLITITATLSRSGWNITPGTKVVRVIRPLVNYEFVPNSNDTNWYDLQFDKFSYSETTFTILPIIRHKYKNFIGWYTDPSAGNLVSIGDSLIRYLNTLYGHWVSGTLTELIICESYIEQFNSLTKAMENPAPVKVDSKDLFFGQSSPFYCVGKFESDNITYYKIVIPEWSLGQSEISDYVDINAGTIHNGVNFISRLGYRSNGISSVNLIATLDGLSTSVAINLRNKFVHTYFTYTENLNNKVYDTYLRVYPKVSQYTSDGYLSYYMMNDFESGTINYGTDQNPKIMYGLPIIYAGTDQTTGISYGRKWMLDSTYHGSSTIVDRDTIINRDLLGDAYTETEDYYQLHLVPSNEFYELTLNIVDPGTDLNITTLNVITARLNHNLKIRTNDFSWQLDEIIYNSGSNWISLDKNSGDYGDTNIVLSVTGYHENTEARTAIVKFISVDYGLTTELEVIQYPTKPLPTDIVAGAYVCGDIGQDRPDAPWGKSFATPYRTIQYAVSHVTSSSNESTDGTVAVFDGNYVENVNNESNFSKSIVNDLGSQEVLRYNSAFKYIFSVNGPSKTFIDGNKQGRVLTNISVGAYGDLPKNIETLEDWYDEDIIINTRPGFTIRNGVYNNSGGGVYFNPASSSKSVIANSIIDSNKSYSEGGGLAYIQTVIGCIINNNESGYNGGGAYNCNRIFSSIISNNQVTGDGGGVHSGILIACLVIYNKSTGYGGGVTKASIMDCTITKNSALKSSGIYMDPLNFAYNSIIYDNDQDNHNATKVNKIIGSNLCTYPISLSGVSIFTGSNNIDEDPMFENPLNYDFHLKYGSPLIKFTVPYNLDINNISNQVIIDEDRVGYYVTKGNNKYPKNPGCYQYTDETRNYKNILKKYRLLPKIIVPDLSP